MTTFADLPKKQSNSIHGFLKYNSSFRCFIHPKRINMGKLNGNFLEESKINFLHCIENTQELQVSHVKSAFGGKEKLPSIAMPKTLDVVKMLGDCLCISIPRRKSHFKQSKNRASPGNYCSHTGMAEFLWNNFPMQSRAVMLTRNCF